MHRLSGVDAATRDYNKASSAVYPQHQGAVDACPSQTMSSPATSPKDDHHCFYATLDQQSAQTYARSKTPYCDTVLLTSVRSIWMPKMSCWLLCVAVGLWATTCPAPTVVQALLSAGGAVGGLTVGRRCEDDWYGLPQDVANDRAAFAFSINFVGALVAVGATLCVQFLSGFDYG